MVMSLLDMMNTRPLWYRTHIAIGRGCRPQQQPSVYTFPPQSRTRVNVGDLSSHVSTTYVPNTNSDNLSNSCTRVNTRLTFLCLWRRQKRPPQTRNSHMRSPCIEHT